MLLTPAQQEIDPAQITAIVVLSGSTIVVGHTDDGPFIMTDEQGEPVYMSWAETRALGLLLQEVSEREDR